jgi:cytochrome c oxidase cbb3-type subunit I
VTFGAFYSVIPQIWGRRAMYSPRLIEWHFWLALAGLLTYVFSLWNAGITQGLMWRTYNAAGTLNYSFIESMEAMRPYYIARFLGGALFLAGICVGAVNIWLTIRGAQDVANDRPLAPQVAE